MVARPATVLKVRGSNCVPTNVSLERQLFALVTDEKYQTVYMFHMGLVRKITLRWFNVLRSARTLNLLTDCRQVSKLDQLVTIQHVAINTHGQK